MVIPGTEATPTQFGFVLSYLQHYVFSLFCPGTGNLISDSEWNTIYELNGNLYAKKVNKGMRLNFYGNLSISASEGAIEIGKLFGAVVYVHKPQANPLHPFSIPAWHVKPFVALAKPKPKPENREAKEAEKTTGTDAQVPQDAKASELGNNTAIGEAVGNPDAVLDEPSKKKAKRSSKSDGQKIPKPVSSMHAYTSTIIANVRELRNHYSLKKVLGDEVELKIPYLVPHESFVAKEDEKLIRAVVPGMLTKAQASEKQGKFETAKQKAPRHDTLDGKAASSTDKTAKHLKL